MENDRTHVVCFGEPEGPAFGREAPQQFLANLPLREYQWHCQICEYRAHEPLPLTALSRGRWGYRRALSTVTAEMNE